MYIEQCNLALVYKSNENLLTTNPNWIFQAYQKKMNSTPFLPELLIDGWKKSEDNKKKLKQTKEEIYISSGREREREEIEGWHMVYKLYSSWKLGLLLPPICAIGSI